jgi:anti-sigma factor (TIGR02949 family)
MTDCDDALTSLYQYLDKELEAASAAEIKLHLDGCDGCLGRFEFETRLKAVVRERLSEDVPEEVIARLRDAMAAEYVRDA